MAQIKLEAFGGMIPGTDNALLPPNAAERSTNVWLYDGRLRPMRVPRLVQALDSNTRSVFRIPRAGNMAINIPSSYWLEFTGIDVCVLKSPVKQATDPAYYWAGDTPTPFEPRYTTQSRIEEDPVEHFLKLGVPAPLAPPTLGTAGGVSTITQTRSYVYTYLTRYNEEGPPSDPTAATTAAIDATWTVTVPAITTERGDATKVITGITQAAEAEVTAVAHDYAEGDRVYIKGVVGMTQINNAYYTITSIVDADNFTVNVDSTAFTAYGSAGTVQRIDREITHIRIYRTVTSDQGVATYYYVAQIAIEVTSYADTLSAALVSTQGALITQEYDPPTTLDGFAEMPNGMIIGWKDTSIYFCEPYKPWAWPASYEQAVAFNVVGIGVVGQTAVICTDGGPYTATGTHPSNVRISKVNSNPYPCTSKGSIVATPAGVYYNSPVGVVLVGPGGGVMATAGLVEQDDWQREINIARLNAAWINSAAYYCFSGVGEGAFEPTAFETTAFEQQDFTGSRDGAMIDFNDKRIAFNKLSSEDPVYNVLADPWSNEVLIIKGSACYQIDLTMGSPEGEYTYLTKPFRQDQPTNYGACRVFYDTPEDAFATYTGTIRFYVNDINSTNQNEMVELYERTIPASGEEFRLPAGNRYDYYQIELEGNLRVRAVHLATTMKELRGMI
jgi:hypothetical protein